MRSLIWLVGFCLIVSTRVWAADAAGLDKARELLARGEAAAAYALLESMEAAQAGQVAYDLLLAQSALLSDKANLALFALDRVVIRYPSLAEARLLRANAYLHLKAYDEAHGELMTLLGLKQVKANVRRQAEQLLEAVVKRDKRHIYRYYLRFGMGRDSNANAATDLTSFLGYDLTANSIATASPTLEAGLGARSYHRIQHGNTLFTALDWQGRQYPSASFVDNDSLAVQLGWRWQRHLTLAWQHQAANVDGAFNNRGNFLFMMYQFDGSMKWRPFVRVGELRFTQTVKDVQQYIFGTQFTLSEWIRGMEMSILLAEDLEIETGSPYGRVFGGLQWQKKSELNRRLDLYLKAGLLYSQYKGLFYGDSRREQQSNLGMELRFTPMRAWEFSLAAAYTDSASTIALYDHDRLIVGLDIKRNI
ncbi:MAG: hypothetical protein HUJ29_13845 [Gammaproteobacteria bacterium]|nr:hypothetical protein [Gammaproteobacteria bacterium]